MSEWTLKEKSTGELVVTVEGDEWKKAVSKAFKKLAAGVTITGFRKGHAPAEILERRIPMQQREYEAIDENANKWLADALKEKNLSPISRPVLDIKSMDNDKVVLSFEFSVYPEFELGTYKGLDYKMGDTAVSEDEFNKELDRMRENYADFETKDGAAEKGDTVNIDYEGFKDGVPFEGGKGENYNLVLGSNSFIPGFEDQLIGAKAGDEKELNLTFPQDYYVEDLKGAPVVFKVKVNEVKTKVLPEVDDDFAKDVNAPGVETAEDLKKTIRERLENEKKQSAETKADNELTDELINGTKIDLPDVIVDDQVQNEINQMAQQLSQYHMKLEQYLAMQNQTLDSLKASLRPDAEKSVRLRMILEKIVEAEKIVPSDEDIEKEYKNLADQYKMDVEKVKQLADKSMVSDELAVQQAYDFVKEHANGYVKPEPAEEKKEEQPAAEEAKAE